MEKLKKMTNFSFKREFSQPHKIPTVPSLSSENIEASHTESMDIEDGLGPDCRVVQRRVVDQAGQGRLTTIR